MPIVFNPGPPPRFEVRGRNDFQQSTTLFVDRSTSWLQRAMYPLGGYNPLGLVEQRYLAGVPHTGTTSKTGVSVPGQNTMRAHHVADHVIQQCVCEYLNKQITLGRFVDRIGTLYLTSWVDVIVTPRLFVIWAQWVSALAKVLAVVAAQAAGLPQTRQLAYGNSLALGLSNSVANVRMGHPLTDNALWHGIAPRLQRGQYDLLAYFFGWLGNHDFTKPTLSVETSLVADVWEDYFTNKPLFFQNKNRVVVGKVFVGPANRPNAIFISEEDPVRPHKVAHRSLPQYYPGARGVRGYVIRASRASFHATAVVATLCAIGYAGKELVWPKEGPKKPL
jgi:hypothetical protein